MRRISLATMMSIVVFAAIAFTAMLGGNDAWGSVIIFVTLGAFLVSILGIVHRRERQRAWWLGFFLFGSAYLVVAFTPLLAAVETNLPTAKLLQCFYREIELSTSFQAARQRAVEQMREEHDRNASIQEGSPEAYAARKRWRAIYDQANSFDDGTRRNNFMNVGHCLSALLCAIFGAAMSSRMYRGATGASEA
jgi:hypothetical protein